MLKDPMYKTCSNEKGETAMSGNGKKDKGNREQRKKSKLNPKEKRKLKNEKKKNKFMPG
jgi:hypothetical protein